VAAKKSSGEEQAKKATPAVAPKRSASGARSKTERTKTNGAKKGPERRPKITHEMIAMRAYLISQSDRAGSEEENWLTAERELRGT
jgi:hypothetical protein